MKRFLFSVLSAGLLLALSQATFASQQPGGVNQKGIPNSMGSTSANHPMRAMATSAPQGLSPTSVAITQDGQYAYLSFGLSDNIFKIRLADLTIVAATDLSAFFPCESQRIALDASEKKLFVYTPTWRKLLVINTETMSLIRTIDDYVLSGMFRSRFGLRLVTWDTGHSVKFVNTETYAVTEFSDPSLFFQRIQEHPADANKWFVVALPSTGGPWTAGLYDQVAKSWNSSVTVARQQASENLVDFLVLSNGQKAYLSSFGGWYPEYHSYGWLYAIDLAARQVKVVPIDGGATCLEVNRANTRLFVGTGWPLPDSNNLLVVDTASDGILGSIPLGKTKFGWAYTAMTALQIDPAHTNLLYGTSVDGNSLIKVDVDGQTLAAALVLNSESLSPHFFVRRQSQLFGNILIQKSAKSFELNINTATIQKQVTFPSIRPELNSYDIGVLSSGRLLIAQGSFFLEVDPQGMQVIATHPLPSGTPGIFNFVLSNDKTRIYAVTYSGGVANVFLAINTATFQVEKQFSLAGGSFAFRPFELPGGAKIYALGGTPNGSVFVHVISTAGFTLQKTLTFNQPGRLGISAGPYYPFAYDSGSHTLFVGATSVVLAIDTSTDEIKNLIPLSDVAAAIGLDPSYFTFVNAVGLVYSPAENYLYIAHLDRSFVSIFDLTNNRFLPKAISLKGFFPKYLFGNDGISKIYSLNFRSDSVSVIDVLSKTIEKTMNLNDYVAKTYPPLQLAGQRILNRSLAQAEYINVLTWALNPNNENTTAYRIYSVEGDNRTLISEVTSGILVMQIRKVDGSKAYTYAVTAVTAQGGEGDPASVTIR